MGMTFGKFLAAMPCEYQRRCHASTSTGSWSSIFSSSTFLFTRRAHANAQLSGKSRRREFSKKFPTERRMTRFCQNI
jgi:hypothetical protein